MKGAFEVMSEQKEMRFTKVSGGKMYLSEEVDGYIEILRNAYSEVLTELDSIKEESAKTREGFTKEQEKANQLLASERVEQQEKLTKLNEELQQEQAAKDTALAQVSNIEKIKADHEANLDQLKNVLAKEQQQQKSLQQELEVAKERGTDLEEQLAKAHDANNKLQREKVVLKETADNSSISNASDYISLLKRTADMTDTYVRDIEEKMSQLETQAKTRCETQISEAHQQSASILEEANGKALNMIKKAESKRQEILTRTRTEYEGIRGLIEQSSKEYGDMATSAKEEQLEWDS